MMEETERKKLPGPLIWTGIVLAAIALIASCIRLGSMSSNYAFESGYYAASLTEDAYEGSSNAIVSESAAAQGDGYMVRSGGISYTTRAYDDGVSALEQTLDEHGAKVMALSERAGSGSRTMTMAVEVTAEGFEALVDDLGEVAGLDAYEVDVDMASRAKEYAGVERRVAFLEDMYERYGSMLDEAREAGELSVMLEVQNAMLSVAEQLDYLGASLADIDDDVATSTLTITVRELSETVMVERGFAERVSEAARNGWASFLNGASDLVVGIVAAWPTIVLLAGAAGAIALIVRRHRKSMRSQQ